MAKQAKSGNGTAYRLEPLRSPELVGEVTLHEANELKARKRVLAVAEGDAQQKAADAQQAANVAALLREGITVFQRELLGAHKLPPQHSYQINEESGQILQTAKAVEEEPVATG